MASEFGIIQRYFTGIDYAQYPASLGIGDDAAIIDVPADMSLAVAVDTLVGDIHFFMEDSPKAIAYKAVAVNLSDLAAMGAWPQWMTLSLSLPSEYANDVWLSAFRQGLEQAAKKYCISLIGGDTTQGPLSVSIQIQGLLSKNKVMHRADAEIGDAVFVSGSVGDAGAGLLLQQNKLTRNKNENTDFLIKRLQYPTPRVEFGRKIAEYAHAAIDISDGLLADLEHILQASHVGASIDLDSLPLSSSYRDTVPEDNYLSLACNSGDDYELCFTVPEIAIENIEQIAQQCSVQVTRIGTIEKEKGLRCFLQGKLHNIKPRGYQHF